MSEIGPDLRGKQLGNWRLTRALGEGAFGAVYEAEHVSISGRRGAVKVLHPHLAFNGEIKRRFVNEASAASRAEHENIVQVFDGGVTDDGFCYCVMELLRGKSLADLVRAGVLDSVRVANIGYQVASALRAAHALGIVHRDLKPDNIFITARETNPEFAKVLDFGVAKLQADDGGVGTKTGMLIGTPAYMSPEQWQTLPDIDGRADLYALGVILYQLVTGRLPFAGQTTYEWLDAHLNQTPLEPTEITSVDARLARLIMQLLAKRREERPQSAAQVMEVLRGIRGPTGVMAVHLDAVTMHASDGRTPTPSAVRAVIAAGASDAGSRPLVGGGAAPQGNTSVVAGEVGGRPSAAHGRGLWWLALGAAALVVGGGAALLWWPRHPRQPLVRLTTEPTPPPAPRVAVDTSPRGEPPTLPPNMVAIPAGTLRMGRAAYRGKSGPPLDVPEHSVAVAPFALGRTEVSVGEFQAYAREEGVPPPATAGDVSFPVVGVGRAQAEAYCRWRFRGGRLPTEAEWEWAARGPEHHLYPFGNSLKRECVNALRSSSALGPVDAFACGATPAGLLGMSGNVWEWTSSPATPYPGSTLPSPPAGFYVVRGGSYFNADANDLTATARQFVAAPGPYIGFRCALDLAAAP